MKKQTLLTLSLYRISANTRVLLDTSSEQSVLDFLTIYPKLNNYKRTIGYFIYINLHHEEEFEALPDDLKECIGIAKSNKASVVCLDDREVDEDICPF